MIDPDQQRLIAAITAAPVAELAPWLAYATWLDARHDRRGDVIRRSIACGARTSSEREKQLSPFYGDDLMSPRLRAQARHWRFAWFRGFITVASLRWHEHESPSQEAVDALLDDPHAPRLQLTLVDEYVDVDVFASPATRKARTRDRHERTRILWWALFARSRPSVRDLHAWGIDQAGIDQLVHLPALEKLDLSGDKAVSRVVHAGLRDLRCHDEAIASTAEIDLPELTFLSMDQGNPPIALLDDPPPKLAEVVVHKSVDLDAIAGSALASQLRVMYLAPSLVREGIASSHLTRFPALKRLVVSAGRQALDKLRRELPGFEIEDELSADGIIELDMIDPIRE